MAYFYVSLKKEKNIDFSLAILRWTGIRALIARSLHIVLRKDLAYYI